MAILNNFTLLEWKSPGVLIIDYPSLVRPKIGEVILVEKGGQITNFIIAGITSFWNYPHKYELEGTEIV